MVVESPYELLELKNGESLRIAVSQFEQGEMIIKPRYAGAPKEKTVKVLRLHVPDQYKTYFPKYYDVTSTTLIAQILPFLGRKDFRSMVFNITAHGFGPHKRFTLAVTTP